MGEDLCGQNVKNHVKPRNAKCFQTDFYPATCYKLTVVDLM